MRELYEQRVKKDIVKNFVKEEEIVEKKVKVFVPIDQKVRREFLKQDAYKAYQEASTTDEATNQKRMVMECLMATNEKGVFTGKSIKGKSLS